MKHRAASLLLSLTSLPPASPFLPSNPATSLRRKSAGAFQINDASDGSDRRQRKIFINVDQNVSMQRAARGDGGAESADGKGNEEPQSQNSTETTLGNSETQNPDPEPLTELPPERRRKRDILKRTFGIGLTKPSESTVSTSLSSDESEDEEFMSYSADEKLMPSFLTAQDEEQLNATYSKLKEEGMRSMMDSFNKGEILNVTLDEATKIVEYAVETELREERDKINQKRSLEALRQYKKEAGEKEEQRVANITSSKDIDEMLEKDAIAREIMTSEWEEEDNELEFQQKVLEMRRYKAELSEKEQDLIVATTKRILEENPDPNLSFNAVYDQVVAGIQKSRKDKLSGPSFGMLSNTIALEQAKQIGMIQLEDERQEQSAREEALSKGYCDEDGLDNFFREPTDVAGMAMFRTIARDIISNRSPSSDAVDNQPETTLESTKAEAKEDDEGDDDDLEPISERVSAPIKRDIFYEDTDAKKKYTLTPSEKVEAFKILNDWRVVYETRNRAISEKKRPTNTIKPLFLYTEESERTKEWEMEEVEKALKQQLKSDDDIENASNDLLIKELMEGGYTKERSIRLVDKLIKKATDKNIKEALLDMKTMLEAREETKEVKPKEKQEKRPLFVDIKQVLTPDEDRDEFEPPSKQVQRKDTVQRMQPPVAQEQPIQSSTYSTEEEPEIPAAARPKSDFFRSDDDRSIDRNRTATTSELLGSYEDQLFKKMSAKMGAQTEEEKAELKRNLDEINALRSKTISDADDEDIVRERAAKLGLDASSLLQGDDPSQLEKLLSQRPVVSDKKPTEQKADKNTSQQHELVESFGELEEIDKESTTDIIGARYRAMTGGDGDEEGEEEFRKFIKEEEVLRKKAEAEAVEKLSDVDIDTYADNVLSTMKPRPVPTEREDEYEAPIEDLDAEKSKLDSVYEVEEDFDPFPVAEKTWLDVEAESEGMRRKDSKRDNKLDAERQRRIEERQKMADAYYERTNDGKIDIAEVLDRPYFGSMDEPDYKEQFYAMSSYEGRKDELMGYTTLVLEDIVNFVAWKTDPAVTGVNKELRRIQSQFSELGAIMRLEGCVIDLIGMQAKTWPKVAEKFGYTVQSEDALRKAALYSPAKAIRMVFGWTDDVLQVNEITKAYHSEFNNVFNSWLEHDRTFVYPNDSKRYNYSGRKKKSTARAKTANNSNSRPSKEEIYDVYVDSWTKLAGEKNKDPPTIQQVMKGISIRDWEAAIPDVFGWTEYNAAEIFDIVAEYDEIMRAGMEVLKAKYKSDSDDSIEDDGSEATLPPVVKPKPSKEEITTTYVIAWNKLAVEIGKTSPTKEEVLKGLSIRDWEVCVKDVFGWTEYSDKEIFDIVVKYDQIVQADFKTLNSNYGLDYGDEFSNKYPDIMLQPDILDWFDKMDSVQMPYVIVTHLGRSQLDAVLDITGLADYFPPEMRVSLDDHYSDERSELLGAALRLEIHPENCIVFDNTPSAAETAHEVLMKCISFVNQYAKYELTAADWTVGELSNLDLSSIRTLFGEREDDIPLAMAESQLIRKRPSVTKTSFKGF